ncbi:MAG TPA: hypothetical protein VIJ75_15445 [Hanamia sp.]
MVAGIDKITAVKMHNCITEAWAEYILLAEKKIPKTADDQALLSTVNQQIIQIPILPVNSAIELTWEFPARAFIQ